MPRLGETVTEGVIVKWLKKEGDKVVKEEPLVEISTDKVETDIPAPADGVLTKIEAEDGKKVIVGDVIAQLKTEGEPGVEEAKPEVIRAEARVVSAKGEPAKKAKQTLSPLVRKLAEEKKIDLAKVTGTGVQGRIRKDDVLSFAAKLEPQKPKEPIAISSATYEKKPLSAVRQQIAEHMMQSKQSTAAVSAIVEVDFKAVDRLRSKYKEDFKKSEGFSLTYLPYVARALIQALKKWPMFNSELVDNEVLIKPNINLGIAVSIKEGLIVPVIKRAEQLNILGLARAINDVATRARSGKLGVDEVHEGTFTITNNGSFGSLIQTPIIVPDQVAILSLEAITKRVVAVDDVIAIRKRAYLPLTYDHRVVDGAEASQFLVDLKNVIENADFSAEFGTEAA